MQHRHGHSKAKHTRKIVIISLLALIIAGLGALMVVDIAPTQQVVEKELDAKAFLKPQP
jgi:hypothetical protein